MSEWSEWSRWTDDDLQREVFTFECDGERLYGSLVAACTPRAALGVVCCPAWGIEADLQMELAYAIAVAAARAGGVGVVYHPPGFGDSTGSSWKLELSQLERAARAALAASARRAPGRHWTLAGLSLGAWVAALASDAPECDRVLLLAPSLEPQAHVDEIGRRARRARLGQTGTGPYAFGYPLPAKLGRRFLRRQVGRRLGTLHEPSAIVQYSDGAAEPFPAPATFERIEVPGRLSFGQRNFDTLRAGAEDWLARAAGGLAAGVPPPSTGLSSADGAGRATAEIVEWPILIPGEPQPLGAVVAEPDGPPRAALYFVQGFAPSGRSGIDRTFARIAHAAVSQGAIAIRVDHPGRRESFGPDEDDSDGVIERHRQALRWFRERIPPVPLILGGSCFGGRQALELAAGEENVAGVCLLRPYLLPAEDGASAPAMDGRELELAPMLERVLDRTAVWALVAAPDDPLFVLAGAVEHSERIVIEADTEKAGSFPKMELAAVDWLRRLLPDVSV